VISITHIFQIGYPKEIVVQRATLDLGIACLYDVKRYTSKEDFLADKAFHLSDNFSIPKYGFLLKDAKKLNEPIPVLGRLGFFNVHSSDEVPTITLD
jgi:hypothetical protein